MLKHFRQKLAVFLALLFILMPFTTITQHVNADDASTGNRIWVAPDYSQVLGNAFFSKGQNTQVSNNFTFYWNDIAKYGNPNKQIIYGQDPSGNDNAVAGNSGMKVASFLHTMQAYSYLNSAAPAFSSVNSFWAGLKNWWNNVQVDTGRGVGAIINPLSGLSSFLMNIGTALDTGATSIINTVQGWFKGFNPAQWLGLTKGGSGFLHDTLTSIAEGIGLTSQNLIWIRNIVLSFLIFGLAFTAIRETSKHKLQVNQWRESTSKLKNYALRIFISFSIIPISLMLPSVWNEVETLFTNGTVEAGKSVTNDMFLYSQGWANHNFKVPDAYRSKFNNVSSTDAIGSFASQDMSGFVKAVNSEVGAPSFDKMLDMYESNASYTANDYSNYISSNPSLSLPASKLAEGYGLLSNFNGSTLRQKNTPGAYWVSQVNKGTTSYVASQVLWQNLSSYTYGNPATSYYQSESKTVNYFGGDGSDADENAADSSIYFNDSNTNNLMGPQQPQMSAVDGYKTVNDKKSITSAQFPASLMPTGKTVQGNVSNAMILAGLNYAQGGGASQVSQFNNQSMIFLLSSGLDSKGLIFANAAPAKTDSVDKYQNSNSANLTRWKSVTLPAKNATAQEMNLNIAKGSRSARGWIMAFALIAIIREPMLLGIWKIISNFGSALALGRLKGAVSYIAFSIAVPMTLFLPKFIGDVVTLTSIGFNRAVLGGMADKFGSNTTGGVIVADIIGVFAMIIPIIIFCWPSVRLEKRKHKAAIITALIGLPLRYAESLEKVMVRAEQNIRGRHRPNVFKQAMYDTKSKQDFNNPFATIKDDAQAVGAGALKVGAGVAVAAATGGAGAGIAAQIMADGGAVERVASNVKALPLSGEGEGDLINSSVLGNTPPNLNNQTPRQAMDDREALNQVQDNINQDEYLRNVPVEDLGDTEINDPATEPQQDYANDESQVDDYSNSSRQQDEFGRYSNPEEQNDEEPKTNSSEFNDLRDLTEDDHDRIATQTTENTTLHKEANTSFAKGMEAESIKDAIKDSMEDVAETGTLKATLQGVAGKAYSGITGKTIDDAHNRRADVKRQLARQNASEQAALYNIDMSKFDMTTPAGLVEFSKEIKQARENLRSEAENYMNIARKAGWQENPALSAEENRNSMKDFLSNHSQELKIDTTAMNRIFSLAKNDSTLYENLTKNVASMNEKFMEQSTAQKFNTLKNAVKETDKTALLDAVKNIRDGGNASSKTANTHLEGRNYRNTLSDASIDENTYTMEQLRQQMIRQAKEHRKNN